MGSVADAPAQELHERLRAVRAEFAEGLVAAAPTGPPPAVRRIRTLAELRGLAAGGRTRGRRSRPTIAGGEGDGLVYAVGDVHGRPDLLRDLIARIAEHAAARPYALVLCGDYVDRGPDSAAVLEQLLGLQGRLGPRLHLLKGNHEQALLRFIDDPASGGPWLRRFGGAATLAAYGVAVPEPAAGHETLARLRDRLLANMPAAHLRLLQQLELMALAGDHAFVHAGVSPDAPLAQQTEDDLLWSRAAFLAARGPFEKIIVHGHTWTSDQPKLLGHRIGLDTGAYETGVLTAVALDGGRREVIQALDEPARRRRTPQAPPLVSRLPDYARAPVASLRLDRRPRGLTEGLTNRGAVHV